MSSAISVPFGELPKGWKYQEVKDNTEFLTGPAFNSSLFNTDGKGARLVRGINLTRGSTRWDGEKTKYWNHDLDNFARYSLLQNDILIGMDGSLVGHNYAYLKESDLPALLVQRVARLRTNRNVDSRFLYYMFGTEAWLTYVEIVKTNSGIPHISNGDIKNFVIPSPPLPEQQKIATILSSVDNLIETTRAQIDKLKDLKTGMMQALLTKGIGSGGVPHTEFKDSPVGRIPSQWKVKSLGELASFVTSGSRGWAQYYSESGAIFIRIGNLTREHINLRLNDMVNVTPPESAEGKRTQVQIGDVLISITADLGVIGVANASIGEAYVNQHVSLVRLDEPDLARWVGHFLAFEDSQKQFVANNDAGAKAGLNLTAIRNTVVAIPRKDEQEKIVSTLDGIDQAILQKRTKLQQVSGLKKALMQDLITGKVRVKIDEKEKEPAVA
jgi:type I restriction enzyme S subunit